MPTIYRNKINYGGSIYLAGSGITAGIIVPYGGSTAPTGWLLCDGSAVSRTGYSQLFDAIGTTYGSGDGSTTFNLPNMEHMKEVVGLGAGVDLGSYTLSPYVCPSNGIVTATSRYYSASYAQARIGANVVVGTASPSAQNAASNSVGSRLVFKGDEIVTEHSSSNSSVIFYPFTYSTTPNYIISIGSQNGGFTKLSHDGVDYQGGIEDEYLLLPSTITSLEDWLNNYS